MNTQLKQFIASLEASSFSADTKKQLVQLLKKEGSITQQFTQSFQNALHNEIQRRGEPFEKALTTHTADFTKLLEQFEKDGAAQEQELADKLSKLDPLDTKKERALLEEYAKSLKKDRTGYEKKVKNLSAEFAKEAQKML